MSRKIIKAPLIIWGESISWRGLKEAFYATLYLLMAALSSWLALNAEHWGLFGAQLTAVIGNSFLFMAYLSEHLERPKSSMIS